MDIYYEYNLINNIPLLKPTQNKSFYFCSRNDIVTPDIVKNIFLKKENIKILDKTLKYIKVNINKNYNDIISLYCYIICEEDSIYENIKIDEISIDDLLKNNTFYYMITYPILKFKNYIYTIKDINTILYINNNNDNDIIKLLIDNNCYTICDNMILIITLYKLLLINKDKFCYLTKKIKKHNIYTNDIWIYFLNKKYDTISLCDFPYLYLLKTPYLIDDDIHKIYSSLNIINLYLQISYKKSILFTSSLSYSYPNTNINFIKYNIPLIEYDIWKNNLNYSSEYINDETSLFIPDFYGLYISIITVPSLWKYWVINKRIIIKTILNNLKNNGLIMFSDSLITLFYIYKYGYDNKKIKKNRVRYIWLNLMNILDKNKNILIKVFEIYLFNNNYFINIPYNFLLDVFDNYNNINIFKYKPYVISSINNLLIYKNISIYNEFSKKNNILYQFHVNYINKNLLYKILYIYNKFGMFKNKKNDGSRDYIIGDCIINYIQYNLDSIF